MLADDDDDEEWKERSGRSMGDRIKPMEGLKRGATAVVAEKFTMESRVGSQWKYV